LVHTQLVRYETDIDKWRALGLAISTKKPVEAGIADQVHKISD
jgi:hypothetical protein